MNICNFVGIDMRTPADNKKTEETGRNERIAAWQTAIGLQAADGLSASDFIRQVSQRNVNGEISIDEAREQIIGYNFERNANDAGDPETEEADLVAANIAKLLLSGTFFLSTEGLASLHRSIFEGVIENPGTLRDQEVSKREWALGGDIVSFANVENLQGTLENALDKERRFRYENESPDNIIKHLAAFAAEMWQICPFGEGNTRTTAVLIILYLRSLGFETQSDLFKNYSWYFHNALVRANYRNLVKNIAFEPVYLERFFRNMLLGEQWDLRNRYLHVRPAAEWSVQPNLNSNISTGQVKVKQDTSKRQDKGENNISKADVTTDKANPELNIVTDGQAKAGNTENAPEIVTTTPKTTENPIDNPNILFLAVVLGQQFLSAKEIMEGLRLKGRDNFLKLYLTPALEAGFVRLLYPMSPRHPRQKYMLTSKGLDFINSTEPEMLARVKQHLGV